MGRTMMWSQEASEELAAITVLENRAGGFPSCDRVEVVRN